MKKLPTLDDIKMMPADELLKAACSIIFNFNVEAPDAKDCFTTQYNMQQRLRDIALQNGDMPLLNHAQILANESNFLLNQLQTHQMRTAPRLFVEPDASGEKWLK